ncbi:hypothetical protein E8E15_005237 [Penicillium rubens]|uniref:Pc22g08320 protein n=2 Tax=Penicillium chrysogenum species complex TaxID=254878 RepID=B6HS97_PENRW|nr:uncharacterized protein N7525_005407 [Penicillium rubens]KZN85551.1 hypothetical protein EN45_097380 [Penicillium chrysogenum]CAP98120.1 Pc22g08320 [Penicillium rubens Wisconsin 54-1255]KAF3016344.1 hypothetical protein E8E15_005237 [Penicillium rubens]KAJ5043922.1 hypothetical protein NUH16_000716 [Penicillium rubens]KAJ5840219.1 hypothetical protein N7525_005407 [Penicillium rubens]
MADFESDEEYEYEYGTETESFYLNLDLTAHHGPVRPPRRRPKEAGSLDDTQNPAEDMGQGFPGEAYPPIESAETGYLPNERIQILDLHTSNPIISYYNQMFSCSWADQIGTELIFVSPSTETDPDNPFPQPLHRGPSYELVAANSVKILGRKAQLAPSAGPGPAQRVTEGPSESVSSQGAEPLGAPRRPAAPSHQAQFLQRLQKIKNLKGEGDTVRTIMSTRRQVNMTDRQQGWARTEAQLAEIERLNERASRGDLEAKATLELLIQEVNQELNPDEAEAESESDSELTSDSDDLTS